MAGIDFTFSDLISGYVTKADKVAGLFTLTTSDGRDFEITLTETTAGEVVRNLGEPYADCTGQMRDMLSPGRYVYAYGIFFPEEGKPFEAKHVVFPGRSDTDFVFEKQNWWIKQVEQLANFYLNAQFPDGEINYSNYRTSITLTGQHQGDFRQETDTISRLVYGFASAYLMTGNDRYLEAAEKGTLYLRQHFRAVDTSEDTAYWYHAIEVKGGKERKILASEFGDDYDAIPAYEQIYALAGPVQTFRATGDKQILADVDKTLNLFERYFLDHEQGSYFSHIDPITFDPRSESLGKDRARKNWNSVGDHAPAYLINLYLATGKKRYADMLLDTANTIAERFPDYENSDFVQEKFLEDWTKDQEWGWQQNRAVVGHNLKIAWNLTRIYNLEQNDSYESLAKEIAKRMPESGMDKQRGGWYDVVERTLREGEKFHRYAWHDRKAWWQQEQGILAYLIMNGVYKDEQYLKLARESSAFYNAWFLDQDSGGIYFNVLANGVPYLMGNERLKGSHSMSGYHSFELCYLAAVYTNLLITKQPMDFYFSPYPNNLEDNILYVSPDLLPKGSIKIESVTINDEDYTDFDAEKLSIKLPDTKDRVKVKVRIAPAEGLDHFDVEAEMEQNVLKVTLWGDMDARAIPHFRREMEPYMNVGQVVFVLNELKSLSSEAARALIFMKQKMGLDETFLLVGANGQPKEMLDVSGFAEEAINVANYSSAKEKLAQAM
ncbi:MAG: AGE family epimerase/isomerase [Bacteroidota bacterium]